MQLLDINRKTTYESTEDDCNISGRRIVCVRGLIHEIISSS